MSEKARESCNCSVSSTDPAHALLVALPVALLSSSMVSLLPATVSQGGAQGNLLFFESESPILELSVLISQAVAIEKKRMRSILDRGNAKLSYPSIRPKRLEVLE